MTPEKKLMNEIRLYCAEHNWVVIRANVGKVQMLNGQWFDTGLPKGWPDLMVLMNDGRTFFCETKIRPRKPSPEQLVMINLLKARGFAAFVSYSLEEFKEQLTQLNIV